MSLVIILVSIFDFISKINLIINLLLFMKTLISLGIGVIIGLSPLRNSSLEDF